VTSWKRAALAAAVIVASAVPAHAAPLEGDALAARVAAFVGDETKGVLGSLTDTTQLIKAPIMGGTTKIRRYVVFHDGIPVAAGVLSIEKNGKPESAETVARLSAETDAKIKSGTGFIHQPYIPKYLHEYRYTNVPCENCTAGETALRFESDHHDTQHVSGTMVVDAQARPLRVTTRPYVYPKPANDGEAVTTFLNVLDGKRLPAEVHGVYRGRQGFISGSMTFDDRNAFRRFGAVEEAVAALSR
jgi:hypothetical protein